MNVPSQKKVRQVVQKQGETLNQQIIPVVNGLLSERKNLLARLDALEAFCGRSCWQRLTWLVLGR